MKTNKTNCIFRLLITAFFIFTTYNSAAACPVGISGLSNPNSIVCAKDANGRLWCTQTDATGHFNLVGGSHAPSTEWTCLPVHGQFTVFNTACEQNGKSVDRDGPAWAGGPWLDVSCKSCVDAPGGMVAWYPLDELSGSKASELVHRSLNNGPTWPPIYSSPLDGVYFGSPAHNTNGFVSNSLKLDGVNDYLEAPHNNALNFGTGNFTIDAWVKVDNPNDAIGVRVIVEKRAQIGATYRGYGLFLYNGKLSLQLAGGNYANYVSNLVVPANGKWHFVAVTVDRSNPNGGTFYLAQEGTPIQQATFNPTNVQGDLDNTRPLRIGSVTLGGPGSLFKGSIDEVELFGRVLAYQGELEAIFLAGRYGKCKPVDGWMQ